jgi:hypothetical protein
MAHKLINHIIQKQRFFVYKINRVSFRERLFCIKDTELPYELTLNYKELGTEFRIAPIIKRGLVINELRLSNPFHSNSPFHSNNYNEYSAYEVNTFEKTYKFRLESEEQCQKNIDEIKKKKDLIDNMMSNFTNEMLATYNKEMVEKYNLKKLK